MKKTRLICMVLTAVLLAVGFASCSKDDDSDSATTANNSHQGGSNGGTTGDWVDLGLPSGLLWATHNVGATNPEDYGDYFAWGETTTKSVYDMNNYAYGYDINGYLKLTKYCDRSTYGYNGFEDGLTTLEAGDDAATVNWGDGARTPTRAEWVELLFYCYSYLIRQNGVYGILFKGRNDNTLFLPAAGYFYRDVNRNYYNNLYHGYYWSSSLEDGQPSNAIVFTFDSIRDNNRSMDEYDRLITNIIRVEGLPVRPVRPVRSPR